MQEITKEYKEGEQIFKFESVGDTINPDEIIKKLIKHGFRPDFVGNILNLIGESLISRKFIVKGKADQDLDAEAIKVFQALSINEELITKAKDLDRKIEVIRNNRKLERSKSVFSFFFFNKKYSLDEQYIAEEHKNDQEMLYFLKLVELQNIARINLAIIRISQNGEKNLNLAKEEINKVKESLNRTYQFASVSKKRLEALEDYLWIISGDINNDTLPLLSNL